MTSRRFRPLAAAAAVAIAAASLSACSTSDALKVCTSVPFEPFQYKDSWQDNKIVGFDVDMMNLVAKKLGKHQEIVEPGFTAITNGDALDEGVCDVSAAGLSITSDRRQGMDFSVPYYDAEQALAVSPDNKSRYKELEDFDGKTVGVQIDTTGADYAKETAKQYGFSVKEYNDSGELGEAIEYGKIAGGIDDVPLWLRESRLNPDYLSIAERYDTGEEYGYAVASGDTDTLDVINDTIESAKKDGTFDKLYKKWIGEKYTGH